MGVRILVTGSSSFRDRRTLFRVLDHIHRERSIREIIQAEAITGAEYLARMWALDYGVSLPRHFIAKPQLYGKRAREELVADMMEAKPDGIVVFSPGFKERDIIEAAKEKDIPVYDPLA